MIKRGITILLVSILILIEVIRAYKLTPEWDGLSGWEWAAQVIRYQFYWFFKDLLTISGMALDRWIKIGNPIYGLGSMLFCLMLGLNLYWIWKQWRLRNRLTVTCPKDDLPGHPIRGTVDRYRCPGGHQFTDQPHGYYW